MTLVGAARFELATPSPQNWCANRASYGPDRVHGLAIYKLAGGGIGGSGPPHQASPTIDCFGEGIAADQGGQFPLHLDLKTFAGAVRVDRHAVNERAERLHEGSAMRRRASSSPIMPFTTMSVLRQQINVLRRTGPTRPAFSWTDRLIFVGLGPVRRCSSGAGDYQSGHRDPLAPMGFRAYWRWKSRSRGGRRPCRLRYVNCSAT